MRAVICDFCNKVYKESEIDSFTAVHIRKNCDPDILTPKPTHPWDNYGICPPCTNKLEGYINGLKLTPESDEEV